MSIQRKSKAQSAMEYLMTYGWAILIIAVVLGALFSLGVFGGGAGLSNACVAVSGYQCQTPSLSTAGALTFTYGQNTGNAEYNSQLACGATAGSTGLPSNTVAAFFWVSGGTVVAYNSVGWVSSVIAAGNTVSSGQVIRINNLPCEGSTAPYDQLGTSGATSPIGTSFSGSIWLNYTSSAVTSAPTSATWLTQKIATITIKVT